MSPYIYRLCTECGYHYMTERELVQMDLRVRSEIDPNALPMPADEIVICPECTHDF